jgi:hypothetical protein
MGEGGFMAVRRSEPTWLYWLSVILGSLSLLLVICDFGLSWYNQGIQAEVNQRQQFLNQTAQLKGVFDTLVRSLAIAAINGKDDKVRAMLAEQGITWTMTPAAGAGTAGASPAAPGIATPSAPAAKP